MWVKLIVSSDLSADLLAELKRDGLTFHKTNLGPHMIAVTTDDPGLARKWDMSALADQEGLKLIKSEILPKESFLDRLANIGALNLIFIIVMAVLVVAWLLRQ
ncbi:MAG TPA: hypothetical protein VGP76_28705 [Planctomycetaceae bacterium]|jgi:hypothetical protein|nr:hypothetical protein [Planctomycetaceae bacterium]